MSGHSHWAGIKYKKALIDKKRGKLWSKLARNVIVAARAGGGNPEANLALRYAIDKARDANMPNDTIGRAIKRGTGELGGVTYEQVVYEGYGPGGVAVMAVCLTDNRNRTASEMRKAFEKVGGSLGTSGCVAWMFEKKGLVTVSSEAAGEDQLMEVVLEAGAEDIRQEGKIYEIICPPDDFQAVKDALAGAKITTEIAEIAMIPQSTVKLEGEQARRMVRLMDTLEDQEDTQDVYANFDVPESLLAEVSE